MIRQLILAYALLVSTHAYLGPTMGEATTCDDAKTGLEIDWNPREFSTFTCPNPMKFAKMEVDPVLYEMPNFNPKTDQVMHKCMNERLVYKETIPLRGDHRPNWAKYGEYLYVPPQRWLHNLEHGAIVLLFHPCVDLGELEKLRALVTSCLFRHVITPYNKLTEQRPLALVGWGAKLELNIIDDSAIKIAIDFIKRHAHVAPEDIERDGLYDDYIINPAHIITDEKDSKVCPHPSERRYNIEHNLV